jgi:hypothetical protein
VPQTFYWDQEHTAQASISGVWGACELTSHANLCFGLRFRNNDLPARRTDTSFAEMITGYPLFRGRDNADQLVQIMKIVGTPSEATIQQIKLNSVSISTAISVW